MPCYNFLLMIIEQGAVEVVSTIIVGLGLIPLAMAFSSRQIEAIFKRDEYRCQFYGEHRCSNPKHITVHHIISQSECRELRINPDTPENAITVCKNAHWDKLHKSKESSAIYIQRLQEIAQINISRAKQKGWVFPKD